MSFAGLKKQFNKANQVNYIIYFLYEMLDDKENFFKTI